MKILTLDNTAYDLDTLPEEVDDMRFAILDNSDPSDPDYKVCKISWDCPWGSKTNTWGASDYRPLAKVLSRSLYSNIFEDYQLLINN
jgi:hypothetical protein